MKKFILISVFSCLVAVFGVQAQTGNHVFSGAEANNFLIVDLATPGGQTWSTFRGATPGYFSAFGAAIYTGATDVDANVDGYVKHYATVADQGFTYPVGTGSDLRELTISGTRTATSEIATAWILGDPSGALDPTAPNAGAHPITLFDTAEIMQVTDIGQWDWQSISADSFGLTVTVSIPDMTGFAPAADLRLVGWDGTQWVNLSGTSGATGNTEDSLLTGTMINGITAITIGFQFIDPCDPIASGNIDTDLDGVADVCDLDDDNDGILDTDEGAFDENVVFPSTATDFCNGNSMAQSTAGTAQGSIGVNTIPAFGDVYFFRESHATLPFVGTTYTFTLYRSS